MYFILLSCELWKSDGLRWSGPSSCDPHARSFSVKIVMNVHLTHLKGTMRCHVNSLILLASKRRYLNACVVLHWIKPVIIIVITWHHVPHNLQSLFPFYHSLVILLHILLKSTMKVSWGSGIWFKWWQSFKQSFKGPFDIIEQLVVWVTVQYAALSAPRHENYHPLHTLLSHILQEWSCKLFPATDRQRSITAATAHTYHL